MPPLFGSNSTDLEFTPIDVEPALTTESSLLDTEMNLDKITTLLRTHGEALGENQDTLNSLEAEMDPENVVFTWPPLIPKPDQF